MDLCLDLETLGRTQDAPVIAIGACTFDPYMRKPAAATHLSLIRVDQASKIGVVDADTAAWWRSQDSSLQKIVFGGQETPKQAAQRFASFVSKQAPENIWANSPSFDCDILKYMFGKVDVDWPFSYSQERDVRTVKALARDLSIALPERATGYMLHHPLGDALSEAVLVQQVLSTLVERCRYTPVG